MKNKYNLGRVTSLFEGQNQNLITNHSEVSSKKHLGLLHPKKTNKKTRDKKKRTGVAE